MYARTCHFEMAFGVESIFVARSTFRVYSMFEFQACHFESKISRVTLKRLTEFCLPWKLSLEVDPCRLQNSSTKGGLPLHIMIKLIAYTWYLSPDLVQSGGTHSANLDVRSCPGQTLICPVRLRPKFNLIHFSIRPPLVLLCSLDKKYFGFVRERNALAVSAATIFL